MFCVCWMRSGVVVSALASITEVKPRGAWLVLRWATVSGFNSQCRRLISICNWPATHACWAFHPSGVGKWVPASAGKAKAGMVHSVSGWTRGVQVKLRDPLRTRAILERLRGVFTTRRYTDPRLSLPSFCLLFYSRCLNSWNWIWNSLLLGVFDTLGSKQVSWSEWRQHLQLQHWWSRVWQRLVFSFFKLFYFYKKDV